MLTVGDELLFGSTHDSNSVWLSRNLAEAGVPVARRAVAADVETEIRSALRWLREEASLVVVTGGLGPTPDDLTRESVAAELGVQLHERPDLLADLEARFRAFGFRELPPGNARQALAPDPQHGAVLPNPLGSAPGLWFEVDGVVACVPGVPREMKVIFRDSIVPRIRARWEAELDVPIHRFIRTHGIAESVLSTRVAEALPSGAGAVSIAFLPHLGAVDIRLTTMGLRVDEATRALDGIEGILRPLFELDTFRSDHGDLAHAVNERLDRMGLMVAVAESCTGGRIAHRLTQHPGASRSFAGGVVAYADAVKRDLLGVPPEILAEHGAVSEPVVSAMTAGICTVTGADCGVGVTGIAGPSGATEGKPVGTVWFAARVRGRTRAVCRTFPGDRDGVRERATQAALGLLYRMLGEGVGP